MNEQEFEIFCEKIENDIDHNWKRSRWPRPCLDKALRLIDETIIDQYDTLEQKIWAIQTKTFKRPICSGENCTKFTDLYVGKPGFKPTCAKREKECLTEKENHKHACPDCGASRQYTKYKLKTATALNVRCRACSMRKYAFENPDKAYGKNTERGKLSCYEIWKLKVEDGTLTQEEADEKLRRLKEKQTTNTTGKNNPMYGKPSPNGTGNGISGVWKGLHFRSLLELAFLEYFQEMHGYLPRSAELKEYRMLLPSGSYYHPDFVDANNIVYEIKPEKFLGSVENLIKFEVARKTLGVDKFKIVTDRFLSSYYKDISNRLDEFDNLSLNRNKTK